MVCVVAEICEVYHARRYVDKNHTTVRNEACKMKRKYKIKKQHNILDKIFSIQESHSNSQEQFILWCDSLTR